MSDQIRVVKHPAATPPFDEVQLQMSRERAVRLFHDLNRVLAIIDDDMAVPLSSIRMDAGDQEAYDRTNQLLCQLQTELQIEPEDPR